MKIACSGPTFLTKSRTHTQREREREETDREKVETKEFKKKRKSLTRAQSFVSHIEIVKFRQTYKCNK